MSLSNDQIDSLKTAILKYDYPYVTKDFTRNQECRHPNMRSVEDFIRRQLTAGDIEVIRDGLSNVLYWGHATRLQIRDYKINDFREKVTKQKKHEQKLENIAGVFCDSRELASDGIIEEFETIRLPQFGFTFATKAAMFLDPGRFVTLDSHIAELASSERKTVLTKLSLRPSIPWWTGDAEVYREWCRVCVTIADEIGVRAVDVERGIFTMSRQEKQEEAAKIIAAY